MPLVFSIKAYIVLDTLVLPPVVEAIRIAFLPLSTVVPDLFTFAYPHLAVQVTPVSVVLLSPACPCPLYPA